MEQYKQPKDPSQRNYAAIDIGLNNFVSLVTYRNRQKDSSSIIINGRGLKSYNKHFNEKLASMKSHLPESLTGYTSKAMRNLCNKKDRVYNDFYNKASKFIVDYCVEKDIDILVVGYSPAVETVSVLDKEVDPDFIPLGYRDFLKMLRYKCRLSGIVYTECDESYTSGTSFLDNEEAKPHKYNNKRRIKRGLFQHNNPDFKTQYINADINSAYQILHKYSEYTDKETGQHKYWVYYRPDYINQSSIEPEMINLDTFNRGSKKKQPDDKCETKTSEQQAL
jgi:putative transposase